MSLDLFEHQICDPLAGCIVHLFLCTQNTFNLPRYPNIQALVHLFLCTQNAFNLPRSPNIQALVHLFLCTQNTFNLPKSPNIQAFFSNFHHSANPKDVEPSSLLFISILNNVMKYIIIDDRLLVTIRMKVQDAKMSNLEYYIANVNPQCW